MHILEQYPIVNKKITDYFSELIKYLKNTLQSEDFSIILTGSLARNEATVLMGKEFWSDIEFFIFCEANVLKKINLESCVSDFNRNYKCLFDNRFFHIDFMIINKKQIRNLKKRLIIFETVSSNSVIFGENLINKFPNVTVKSIDFEDLNDVLNHRLFSVYRFCVQKDKKSKFETIEVKYILARNSLDLLTVILPVTGVLLSGYKNRLNFFKENYFWLNCNWADIFNEEFLDFMKECLNCKLNPERCNLTVTELSLKFIKYMNLIFPVVRQKKHVLYFSQLGILKRILSVKVLPASKKSHYFQMCRDLESYFKNICDTGGRNDLGNYDEIKLNHYLLYGYPK